MFDYPANTSEYVSIDGASLMTHAWTVTDTSGLYVGAANRGADIVIPGQRGTLGRRRTADALEVSLPIVIFGDRDPYGNVNEDVRAGLLYNIDALKAVLTNNTGISPFSRTGYNGTRHLAVVTPTGTRYADVYTTSELSLTALGPGAAQGVITLTIPAGVFRGADTFEQTEPGFVGTLGMTVEGTAEITDAVISIIGKADSVLIKNLTMDPTGNTYLACAHAFDGSITINCGTFLAQSANYGRGGGFTGFTNITKDVYTAGTSLWLPLLPGDNQLELNYTNPSGNFLNPSIGIQTTISYRPSWT